MPDLKRECSSFDTRYVKSFSDVKCSGFLINWYVLKFGSFSLKSSICLFNV